MKQHKQLIDGAKMGQNSGTQSAQQLVDLKDNKKELTSGLVRANWTVVYLVDYLVLQSEAMWGLHLV